MTQRLRLHVLCVAMSIFAAQAFAQKPIPVRSLTPLVATDSGVLVYTTNIRPLSDGRVIVNDAIRHRILLFDSTLKRFTTLADTAEGAPVPYGSNSTTIIPYLGDSTIFVDQNGSTFVIIDPAGKFTRAIPPSKPDEFRRISLGIATPVFDPSGRLVFRVTRSSPPNPQATPQDSGTITITLSHDSSAIIREDLYTRAVDTLATFARTVSKTVTLATGRGGSEVTWAINPLPTPDEYAMLPDGAIAIVRGHDYHIDWVSPGGKMTSSPKMAFDWRRITFEEKQHILDSLRKAAEARAANARPQRGLPGMIPMPRYRLPIVMYEPNELPDYYPPIRLGQVKADPEGNLWILPTTSVLAEGGLAYDLVNRNGEVIERVKLPAGRALVAIGVGGVLYMSYSPRGGYARLERARVVR